MHQELWPEAISCAVYVKNRLPTATSRDSPFARLLHKEPNLWNLVEFGREVHMLVNDQYLTKFDARTRPGHVVGYTHRRNTYRVFDPLKSTVVETCDIIFKPHRTEFIRPRVAQDTKEETIVITKFFAKKKKRWNESIKMT